MRELKITLDSRAFQEAKAVRLNSTLETKVGAVITKGSKVLSCACNVAGSFTFRAKGIHTPIILPRHAEVMAVLYAGIENVREATIWVWRQKKDDAPGIARPCDRHCIRFLKFVGVKTAVYTTSEPPYFTIENLE